LNDRQSRRVNQQSLCWRGLTRVPLPPWSPNLNAYAERWVRSVKEECLSRLILFGEAALGRALHEYVEHYHHERNHQGKGGLDHGIGHLASMSPHQRLKRVSDLVILSHDD
jgi:transposase InsO family protein